MAFLQPSSEDSAACRSHAPASASGVAPAVRSAQAGDCSDRKNQGFPWSLLFPSLDLAVTPTRAAGVQWQHRYDLASPLAPNHGDAVKPVTGVKPRRGPPANS